MNFIFVVREQKIYVIKNNVLVEEEQIFICVKNQVTGMLFPHPITNFIKTSFERKTLSLKTKKNYAEEIKKFLNYILICNSREDEIFIDLLEKGISGLKLKHGASYITHLTQRVKLEGRSPKMVFEVDRLLTKLYFWLYSQKIIDEKVQYREEIRKIQGRKEVYVISPFDNFELGTEYPSRKERGKKEENLKDFGEGRIDLINRFLRIAELEAPDIALGIALQFYGGVRRGEAVNLLERSIKEPSKNGAGEFLIEIKDNYKLLFPEKINTSMEQVKNERTQFVFKVPIVLELLEKNKKNLNLLKRKGKLKNKHALLVSIHTGKPVTGMMYWERFTKVKNIFLKELLNSDEETYSRLISKPWSTHIGRGIFTNILVFLLGWSAEEVRIARGDRNIQSSKDYIEEGNVKKKTEEAIEKIAKAATQQEKKITKIEDLRGL